MPSDLASVSERAVKLHELPPLAAVQALELSLAAAHAAIVESEGDPPDGTQIPAQYAPAVAQSTGVLRPDTVSGQ